jgi:hypothetical protein
MKMPIAIRSLAHRVPGRLHLSLEGLEAESGWAERLERDLARLPGLHRISASLASGSVLLRFDPMHWDAAGIVQAIGRVLERPCHLTFAGPQVQRDCGYAPGQDRESPVPLAVLQMYVVDRIWDLKRLASHKALRPEAGGTDELLEMALRLGVLCHPHTGPDLPSLAFERAARQAGLPVHNWRQQYRGRDDPAHSGFVLSLKKRGRQLLALGRGEPERILGLCGFYQDRQGCHTLGLGRGKWPLERSAALSPAPQVVALAYRPLLFGQGAPIPFEDWILVGFASLGPPPRG